ncbi:hypothetical protein D3C79_1097280 [compost metagenome]
MDNLSGRIQRVGQFLNRTAVEIDQLMTGTGFTFGLIGRLRCLLGIVGDLGDAGSHLVDGGGDLVGFALLLQAIAVTAVQ